ncbi:beta strand repeat-containing protein [Singulisphaera sp. PoT]|uniref:beta strand repeat-containing protein n=1 Tax=Singulisphaera sp. PoT TaxID=3411797 RepID=UPI003BF5D0ED
MECLEERVVLSNITWINPQSGDWNVASNWSEGRVPNAQDDVFINASNITIAHSSSVNDSARSITSNSPITVSGGILQLGAASSINAALKISGGSLIAGGSLTAQSVALASGSLTSSGSMSIGQFAWTGGNVLGVGQIAATSFQASTSNFTLSKAALSISAGGLMLAGDASLPVIGNARLSGSITSATTYSLTAQIPSLKVAGYTFTNDTVTLANGALSLSGTATLPVIGTATLSGTITDASNYSLTTQVASLKLGAYTFSNDTVALTNGSLSVKGTADLPVIGPVTLAGTFKDTWNYNLSAQVPSLKAAGFTFSNSTVTLAPGVLALSGSAALPVVGSLPLAGTINDVWNYNLTAQVPSLKVAGLTFTDDTVTLSSKGLSFKGTATLPVVGSATLSGNIVDAGNYSLATQVASLKLGGFNFSSNTISLANGVLSIKGTADLPVIGSVPLSGTFKDAWNYTLTAQVPSLKVAGFTFSNDTVTLTPTALGFSGTAALPVVGSVPLSGNIKDTWNYNLSAQVPSLKVAGFTFSDDTVTLSSKGLSFKGTATLPVVGTATLSGTIVDASNYSLTTQVPSVKLGAFTFTDDTISLTNGALSIKGTASLPVIGPVTLAGTFKDTWNYNLSAQVPSLKAAGFTFSNSTVTLAPGVLALSGSAALPVVGSLPLAGTINDVWNYTLTAQVPSLKVAGFTFTDDTVTLSSKGLSLKGTTTLPVVGTAALSGTIVDANNYTLSAQVPTLTLGGYSFVDDTVTLANGTLSIKGTADLPVIGSVTLSGTFKDTWNYSLSAQLPTLKVAGFAFTNDTVTFTKGILSLSGTATLPVVGTAMFSGTINDIWNYTLTAQLPSLKVAGFTFTDDTVTLSNRGISLKGTATLPVVGTATLSGTITDATRFSLTGSPGNLKLGAFNVTETSVTLSSAGSVATLSLGGKAKLSDFGSVTLIGAVDSLGTFILTAPLPSVSLLGGLVKFSSLAAIMTASSSSVSVGITGTGLIANIGTVSFKGTVDDEANYTLTGKGSVNIAGFSIDTANFALGTQALGVAFTLPVPGIGNMGFTGSYGPGGQWSLGATYPGPVQVGPVTLTDLGFVLATDSLTLKATGSIADLQALANVKVTAQIFYDGRFMMTADATVVQVGPFSLAQAIVTIGNDHPNKQFQINVHAVTGFPNLGAGMTLDGIIINAANYRFTGTDNLSIAGLTITTVQATLDSSTGFTFTGAWNYGVLNAKVSGTISGDGKAHFEGNASTGVISGFPVDWLMVGVDADPVSNNYSIDAAATVNAYIASLYLQAHSTMGSSGWQPLVFTAVASLDGALSSFLEGGASFTAEMDGISFSGWVSAANGLGIFDVSGKVYSNGSFEINGFVGDTAQILAEVAAKILNAIGAGADQIANVLKSVYNSTKEEVARFLSSINTEINQIADVIQNVFNANPDELAKALWNNATSNLSDLANVLKSKVSVGTVVEFFDQIGQRINIELNFGGGYNTKVFSQLGDLLSLDQFSAQGVKWVSGWLESGRWNSQVFGDFGYMISNSVNFGGYGSQVQKVFEWASGGIQTAFREFNQLGGKIADAWLDGGKWISQQLDGLGHILNQWTYFGGLGSQLQKWSQWTSDGVATLIQEFNSLGGKLRDAWLSGSQWISQSLDGLGHVLNQWVYFGGLGSQLQRWNQWTSAGVINAIQEFNVLGGMIADAWNSGGQWISQGLDGLGNVLSQFRYFGGYGSQLQKWSSWTASGVATAIQEFNSVGGKIADAWLSSGKWISQKLDGVGHVLEQFRYFGGLGSTLQQWNQWSVAGIVTGIQEFNSVGGKIRDAWISSGQWISQQLDGLGNVLEQFRYFGGYGSQLQRWNQWTAAGIVTGIEEFNSVGGKIRDAWLSAGRWVSQNLDGIGHVLNQWYYYGGYGSQIFESASWNAAGVVQSITRWTTGNLLTLDAYISTTGNWVERYYSNGTEYALRVWNSVGQYLGDQYKNWSDAAANLDPTTKDWWPF